MCRCQTGIWNHDITTYYHRILRHSPKLNFSTNQNCYALSYTLTQNTTDDSPWASTLKNPKVGIRFSTNRLAPNDTLGYAISILPVAQFKLWENVWSRLDFEPAVGLGYLTKKFSPIDNPKFNAIGSNVNIAIQFSLIYRARIHGPWRGFAGADFTHFSNGAFQLPNFGINLYGILLGLSYTPESFKGKIRSDVETTCPTNSWLFSGHLDLSVKESQTSGGPKQPVYIASVGTMYHYNAGHRGMAGLEYEFHWSVYQFGLHTFTFHSKDEARKKASRLAIYAGHELMMGRVGVHLKIGAYISSFSHQLPFPVYTKLGIRYYHPVTRSTHRALYLGAYLKAHLIDAEYASLGIGVLL